MRPHTVKSLPSERLQRLERQRALLKKIEESLGPTQVVDVTDVASSLVVLGIMQMFNDKDMALKYLDTTYLKMADIIINDFDGFRRDMSKREMN